MHENEMIVAGDWQVRNVKVSVIKYLSIITVKYF